MIRNVLTLTLLFNTLSLDARAADWPDFRGPTGQGHAEVKDLPLEWSPTKNIVWKQPLPGSGWSSPIVLSGRVYLTTAVSSGKKDTQALSLRALCLDGNSGKIIWNQEVFLKQGAEIRRIHAKNSHASPSPVTDGKRLYVHFGHLGTACLDLDGKVLWRQTQLGYAPVHGSGGSPILVDDLLVFSSDGSDQQFVVGLDTATGKVRWKTDRASEAFKKFSFCTPLLITVNGARQIVSPASDKVCAYDPKTGKEIWRVRYDGYSVVPRPVFAHGLVFLSTGYDSPQLLAVRADGTGDVTDSHVAWSARRGAPHTPSPLVIGDELYMVSDLGVASCLDARTGKVHWQERLGGAHSASPLFAAGRIYFQSEEGDTVVVKPGKQFEQLAKSSMGERTFTSFAPVEGALYLRSEKHLYKIGK